MKFREALEAVKEGKLIARSGWNGKGMFVFQRPEDWLSTDMIVNKVKSLPDSFKKYVNDYYDITETNMIKFCSYLCMKDANDNIVNGWLASQSDMLADDWMVVGLKKNINMSRVDKIFQDNLALIMSQPWEEVKRPVYGDGTGVKVKRILQVCNQYDLRREFPLGSLRPTNLKNSIKEILWIWQKRSVDIKDLGLRIWDQWADDNGKIEGCYGDMVNRHVYMGTGKAPEGMTDIHDGLYGFLNQTDFILWSLKNDRSSRRIVASMFDPETNGLKPLQECAFQINLSVKGDELYMTLYQRSQDMITASYWNVAQYAALMMMFAHDAGLRPAVFTHFIQDMHVYDRHEEQANELLRRSLFGPVPQVTISSRMEGKGFYDFVADDFEVWNYEPKEQMKFEIAK